MKIKSILLISDFAYPVHAGTERIVFGIADYFTKNYKIKVDILTPNWKNEKEREKINNITIYRFKTHNIYSSKPLKRIMQYIVAGFSLEKYDVYHGFYTLPPLISTIFLAKLKNAKSIITFFGRDQLENNFANPIKKHAILKILNKANQVTTYTWFLEKYFKEKNLITTQGWIEPKFKKIKVKKQKKKIVLFVGRMEKQKEIFVLLKAFAKIKNKVNAKLVLIGPTYDKKNVEKLIKKLKLEKQVDLLGFVSEKKLNEMYNLSYLVVVPALHRDGFGLSLMEAMGCGKPVISTDIIGSPEKNGKEALTVKPNNVNDLTKKLLKILTDKKFFEKYRKIAINNAKLFNKKLVMEKYLEMYKKVINN